MEHHRTADSYLQSRRSSTVVDMRESLNAIFYILAEVACVAHDASACPLVSSLLLLPFVAD